MIRWLCLLCWMVAAPALAHGGEEHGEASPPVASARGDAHVLGATGDVFEVVLEHPEHGEGGRTPVRVLVAETDTNAPVLGAQVELTLTGPSVQKLAPKMDSPGVYLADAELPVGAEFAAVVTVTRGDAVDVLSLGMVHLEPEEHASAQGSGASKTWLLALAAGVGLAGIGAWTLARRMRRVTP
ncbi:hypothetical protein [Hyalangium versicolor]|uniref:hypothetical protein n=1 Tax=Hyalangium versicolor TaxID=2861190 RepID=UPI001CCF44FD|nr:hypothetical protein [Hyalangium versicolor]